jgi:hypothetical protein
MSIQCQQIVKQNGLLLEFIKNQTYSICIEAVKQNAEAIKFVKELNNDVVVHALMKDGNVLKYLPQYQVPPFCLLAVTSNPDAIRYIPYKFITWEIKEVAINSQYALTKIKDYNQEQIRRNVELFNYDIKILENINIQMPNEFWLNGLKHVSNILTYAKPLNYYLVLAACLKDPANLYYTNIFNNDLKEYIMRLSFKENPMRAIFYVNKSIIQKYYFTHYPKFNYNKVYYKLINHDMTHNGFKYSLGKNRREFKFDNRNILDKILPESGMSICLKEDLPFWRNYINQCYPSLNLKYVAVICIPENTYVINHVINNHKYFMVENLDIFKLIPINKFKF